MRRWTSPLFHGLPGLLIVEVKCHEAVANLADKVDRAKTVPVRLRVLGEPLRLRQRVGSALVMRVDDADTEFGARPTDEQEIGIDLPPDVVFAPTQAKRPLLPRLVPKPRDDVRVL